MQNTSHSNSPGVTDGCLGDLHRLIFIFCWERDTTSCLNVEVMHREYLVTHCVMFINNGWSFTWTNCIVTAVVVKCFLADWCSKVPVSFLRKWLAKYCFCLMLHTREYIPLITLILLTFADNWIMHYRTIRFLLKLNCNSITFFESPNKYYGLNDAFLERNGHVYDVNTGSSAGRNRDEF